MKIFLTHSQTVPVRHILFFLLRISNKDCINEHTRPYSLWKSSTVENKIENASPSVAVIKNMTILVHNV